MKRIIFCFALIFSTINISFSEGLHRRGNEILLWKGISSMEKYKSVLYVHEAKENNTGAAVIVCPGGSYHHLGLYNEGYKTSEWFASKGVTSFTLRYRTAQNGYHSPAMLQDIQRAIQLVRENAEEFGIDVNKLGVIGYSAGGHLVAMAGAFWQTHDELEKIAVEHSASLRPDFVIPVYPVVSMGDELAHRWSRKSLLGKNHDEERKNEFSMEKQIPTDMPPSYIVVCKDDPVVDYRNSFALYEAMLEKNIDVQLAVYDWGKHGFGMLNNRFMKEFHWNEKMWNEFFLPVVLKKDVK